ncbi:glycosyltransferase family protein [Marisediminicola senii]|uniref:hypothetical protein n=1 Tax=Marisediminicola senii TaxID=2711233 RepID=UPI0013EE2055|nr:hypothetical protein [Marisediminicola senii]
MTRARVTQAVVVAAAAIALLVISVVAGRGYPQITIFDEAVHFDYIVKLVDERTLPTVADTLSPETLREIACRGTETTCATQLQNSDIPVAGVNYVLMYGPIYYGLVALFSAPFSALTGVSLFDSARTATSLLTAIGGVLFLLAALRLGARKGAAVGLLLATATAPLALLQGATISPDSMGLLFAGAICLAATARGSWRRRMVIVVVICCLAALNKANFIPLATAGIWLATIAPTDDGDWRLDWADRWKSYVIGVAASVLPLVAQYAYNSWRVSYLPDGVPADGGLNDILYTDRTLFSVVADGTIQLMQPIHDSGFPAVPELWAVGALLQALIFGGAFALVLMSGAAPTSRIKAVAIAGTAGLALSFVFLPVTFYVLYHSIGTQSRYGLPILMLLAIAVVASIRGRAASWFLLAAGIAVYGCTVYFAFQ